MVRFLSKFTIIPKTHNILVPNGGWGTKFYEHYSMMNVSLIYIKIHIYARNIIKYHDTTADTHKYGNQTKMVPINHELNT